MQTETLNKMIQEQVKAYIRDHALRPGDKLPTEAKLAEELGVSRPAIREALRGLEALGIIEVQRGSGRYLKRVALSEVLEGLTFLLEVNSTDLADLLEIRGALEGQFIAQAIDSLSDWDILVLESILAKMQQKILARQPFTEEDRQFHSYLFSRIPNQLFKELMDIFWLLFTASLPEDLNNSIRWDKAYKQHLALVEAVRNRDHAGARKLLENHAAEVYEHLP